MARPRKEGMDYFPLDVSFMEDIKVRKILRAYGPSSISVLIYLYCLIYKDHGYYIDVDDDLAFLVAESLNVEEAVVNDIIVKSLSVGLFNQSMYDNYKILTSKGIQRRFVDVARRKKVDIKQELDLLNDGVNATKTLVNVAETRVNATKTLVNVAESTQRKEKKIKVKKIKTKKRKMKSKK